MAYSATEVKRSIRDFNNKVSDVLNSTHWNLDARVKQLMHMVHTNEVIRSIVQPLLEKPLDWDALLNSRGGWHKLNLPTDDTDNLAFVFQLLKKSADGQLQLDSFALSLYRGRYTEENLAKLKNDLLRPAARDLANKLQDLVEDEVEGEQDVQPRVLQQFFAIGSIEAAQGSNVAVGHHINQQAGNAALADEILKKAQQQDLIDPARIEDFKTVLNQLLRELSNPDPRPSSLKRLVEGIWAIGKKGLTNLVTQVISNRKLSDAVNLFLMDLVE